MTTVLVAAVVQLSSQADVAANMARVRHWVAEAARAGARLVALPENFAFMGEEADKKAIAEDPDAGGPILRMLAELSRAHGVHIVAGGLPERSADPQRPYNTSVLVSPDGALRARYRKIHLFDVDLPDGTSLKESRATMPGSAHPDDLAVAEVEGVGVGMTICYDLRFPELYRALGARGARVVTVPAAFTLATGKDHWHMLLRARAVENQVYILAPAQTGKHPRGRHSYGKSLIVDPWGDVLAQCGEGEGMVLARLDLGYQEKVRSALPCLSHRRM